MTDSEPSSLPNQAAGPVRWRRAMLAAGFLALATFLTLGWIASSRLTQLAETDRWESHTQEVLQELDQAISALAGAESAQYGYVATGDSRYLETYHREVQAALERLAQVRGLTTDNALQQQRLAELDAPVQNQVSAMQRSVSLLQARDYDAAQASVRDALNLGYMARIRQGIDDLHGEEQRLLAMRSAAKDADIRRTVQTLAVGGVFGTLVLLAVFTLLWREIARRRASEAALQAHRDSLADLVGTRTRYLNEANQDLQAEVALRLAALSSLRQSESRLRLFIEHAPVALAMFDGAMRYIAVSRRWLLDYGLGDRDLIGLCHYDVFPGIPESSRAVHRRALAGEVLAAEADCFERADGSVQWLRWEVRPWHDAEGAVGGIVIFSEDITSRRQAEVALQEHQARLEAAVADRTEELRRARNYFRDFVLRAPIAMWVVEADGRIPIRNEQFLSTFGYGEEEMPTLAEWWLRAYPDPGYREWVMETWQAAVQAAQSEGRAITPLEYQVTCWDGSVRTMEISGIALGGGFLATFFDVTARRQAEAELRVRRDEAEAANQAKSDFLAAMSHEIRTPMNAILGTALVLERSRLDSDQRLLVETIRTAGRSLLGIINDILDLSKIEAGHFRLENAPFVLHNVLSNLVDVLTPSAMSKGLALELAPLPPGIGALVGDAQRLGQVLYNLAGNAIKFTHAGRVTVSVHVAGLQPGRATLRFAVRDTGIGIAADRLDHLFEAFVQADNSTSRRYGGTGLGLAISRQLVTLMDGEIGVASQAGQGSEFWFVVPFETIDQAQVAAPAPVALAGREKRLPGLRVLVVDDSQVNQDVARRLLTLEGALCETACDGRDAVERLRRGPEDFDLVLMDVQMPDMDGLAATQAIRGELGLAGLPVIALTAGALPSQHERATAAGMNDFIAKPFELDTLVATLLRHAVPPPQPAEEASKAPAPQGDGGDFPALPGIDSRRAAQRLLGDRSLFFSVLRVLRNEFAQAPAQTRADLARGDLDQAMRRAHKLRGTAGTAAAEKVAARAEELETALRRNETANLDAQVDALEEALDEVIAGLPAEVDEAVDFAAPAGASREVDPAMLESLMAALADSNMSALQAFERLRPGLAARHGGAAAASLAEAMESLRFAEVAAQLQAWYPHLDPSGQQGSG